MQMRLRDLIVNETLKFQFVEPTNISRTISVRADNMDDVLVIPLDSHGAVSCFELSSQHKKNVIPVTGMSLLMKSQNMTPPSNKSIQQEADMTDSGVN